MVLISACHQPATLLAGWQSMPHLAGEQRRVPAAHGAMLSVLNTITANLATERNCQLGRQHALAAVGDDMLEDTRCMHEVWCAADMPDCAGAPSGVHGADGFHAWQPQ